MEALEKTQLGYRGKIQLTDGVQKLIDIGLNVYATKMRENEISWVSEPLNPTEKP